MTISLNKVKTAVVWRSATGGAKTTSIPGSSAGNKGFALDIITPLNSGDMHSVTPTSGTIEGLASLSFLDNGGSLSLLSDADNTDWIVVCLCTNTRLS
jgi:hypothetical protein